VALSSITLRARRRDNDRRWGWWRSRRRSVPPHLQITSLDVAGLEILVVPDFELLLNDVAGVKFILEDVACLEKVAAIRDIVLTTGDKLIVLQSVGDHLLAEAKKEGRDNGNLLDGNHHE
jgi:hypothetical protein